MAFILELLYKDEPLPKKPVSNKTSERIHRNRNIRQRYQDGETIAELARAYNLSDQRIHQIVNHKRK